jgi:squalene cyclase
MPAVDEGATLGTALAAIALLQLGGDPRRVGPAVSWLVEERCREAHWLWRWKLRVVDNKARFDPANYGWGWVPDTVSWVIPTGFAIIALEQAGHLPGVETARLRDRVALGREMLLDRACPTGGWNAGNGVVHRVALKPHIDTTATAVLALKGWQKHTQVQDALRYLATEAPKCLSPYSVAWAVLALSLFRGTSVDSTLAHLEALLPLAEQTSDVCTTAVCCLALDAMEGRHVFRTAA